VGRRELSAEAGSLSTRVEVGKRVQRADRYRSKLFKKNTLRVQIGRNLNTKYKSQDWRGV
jgi:hypothetical protein